MNLFWAVLYIFAVYFKNSKEGYFMTDDGPNRGTNVIIDAQATVFIRFG